MFKMEYLINRLQCNTITMCVMAWVVGVFIFILEVKGSNLTNGVFVVVNSGKLTELFSYVVP
jgi:hypothetical protein